MSFHSFDFIIFFAIVLTLYWCLPMRKQNQLLLVASYFFYGYIHPWFLTIIATSTIVDYLLALGMERFQEHKKKLLILSLVVNLSLLGVFKYFYFFVENVVALLELLGLPGWETTVQIFLPVGISFYTFQSLSYTIDVYRGELRARTNFFDFALFVSFFPQLVAGPIERAKNLLPQIEKTRTLDANTVIQSVFLLVWGFFVKLVVADNVAIIANKVFLLQDPPSAVLWVGIFSFCIQIYADFMAYTNMARGCAALLGFQLSENFNHPYIARSPSEFWQRWHISLSQWIRDYLYIPLGGSRCGVWRSSFNLMVAFLLCGFWHGASWHFILWGGYYGVLILLHRGLVRLIPASWRAQPLLVPFQILFMFLLTNIGWLIFREENVALLWRDFALLPAQSTPEEVQIALFLFGKALLYSLPLWIHTLFALNRRRLFHNHPRLEIGAGIVVANLLFLLILIARAPFSVEFIYFQF